MSLSLSVHKIEQHCNSMGIVPCSCSCLFPVLNSKPLRLELDRRWGGIGSLQVAVSCSLSLAGVGGQFRLTICVCMMCMVLAFNLPRTWSSLPLADTFKVSHLFLLNQDLLNLNLNGSSSNGSPLSLSLASQRGGMGTFILSSATVAWGHSRNGV